MKKIPFLFFIFFSLSLFAQQEYAPSAEKNEDYTYYSNIKSIRLYQSDAETDYPYIGLNSGAQLVLEFDDMDAYSKNYYYKIIHCDANWQPSKNISVIDYIEGFQENRIYDGKNSFNPHGYEYVHYELKFPNSDVKFKISGNYLLKVYLNADENEVVLTRRFMIAETRAKVVPTMRRSATPPNSATHQEYAVSVQYAEGITVANPYEDIKTVVLQNGRWDMAHRDLKPSFIKNDEIIYDLQGKIVFPAMREFRPLDLRTFRARSNQVRNLYIEKNAYHLELFDDFPRPNAAYSFINDLNGKFIIQSFDFQDKHLQGEYGNIKFFLNMDELEDKDIYIVGGFTDWQLYPDNILTYNSGLDSYEAELILKNGFYDYHYVTLPKTGKAIPSIMDIEGSSYETENDYLFLVYYRPYGGRYDQLIAIQKANSRPR